jgi:acetolactate synthase I/II/III large subunit
MTLTGGELLLNLFQNQGIEYIFCSPGTEWAPVWEGLLKRCSKGDNSVKYINCRHETLAFSMAQGYASTTGKIAAVLVHSGVGLLSGAISIRNAYSAGAPMLIMSGETYEHSIEGDVKPQGWQWLELLSDAGGPSSLVKGYVKWCNSIRNRDNMIDMVWRGCRISQAPVPGPVYLSVTPELLARSFPDTKFCNIDSTPIKLEISRDGIAKAADWLTSGCRPVIITEYAGKKPAAVDLLVKLAELLSIPVFEFLPFFGNFPKSHPLYMGYDASTALKKADTVLIAGSALPWYPPASATGDSAKVILLDEDTLHSNMSHWGYHIDLTLTADIERGLAALIKEIKDRTDLPRQDIKTRAEHWRNEHDKMQAEWQAETLAEQDKRPISTKWLLNTLQEKLPANAWVIDETLTHTKLVHRYLGRPDCYIRPNYGGLGVGFGEALGIKLVHAQRPVFFIVGDGAFNYNPVLAGLGLSQEYHLPIFTIILNNGGYGAMKKGHLALYPQGCAANRNEFLGVNIWPSPDYARIAGAFGAYGEKVEKPADFGPALDRGLLELSNGRAVLLDAACD